MLSDRTSKVAVALMAGVLLTYLAVHQPLSRLIRELVGIETVCRPCGPGTSDVAASLAAIFLLASSLLAAHACLHGTRLRRFERLPVLGLLWYGWIVASSAWIGWTGDLLGARLLQVPAGPVLSAIPGIIVMGLAARKGWQPWRTAAEGSRILMERMPRDPMTSTLGAVAAVLMLASVGVSLQVAPHRFDELGYHAPLAILYWRDGSLGAFLETIFGYPLAHPGSAELVYGLGHLIGGEPLASISQFPFAFLAVAGIAAFARRSGLSPAHARLAGLAFLVAPIVVIQAGFRNNDLVGASLVIVTAALAVAAPAEWDRRRAALVGLGLGLMAATKLALLPAIAAIALFILLSWARQRGALRRGGRRWGELRSTPDRWPPGARAPSPTLLALLLISGFVMAAGPWWLRGLELYGNPVYPVDIPLLGLGAAADGADKDALYVPNVLLWPLYPLLEPHNHASGLGAVYAVAVIPGALLAMRWARRRPLVMLATLVIVSLPPWWLLTRHEPRFLLGLFGLSFALLPWILARLAGRWVKAASVILAVAAVGSAGITLTGPIAESAALPRDPVALYVQEWGANEAVLSLPEDLPLLLDDRCGGPYQRLYPHFGRSQARQVNRIGCGATATEVEALMRGEGIAHVFTVTRADDLTTVDERYPEDRFELLDRSLLETPDRVVEGRLYRLRD